MVKVLTELSKQLKGIGKQERGIKEDIDIERIRGKEGSPERLRKFVKKREVGEKRLEELSRERTSAKLKAGERLTERASKFGERTLAKRLLKKPKAKVPSYSSTKVLKQLARQQGALVREAPEREVIPGNRSLFFKEEFSEEKRSLLS